MIYAFMNFEIIKLRRITTNNFNEQCTCIMPYLTQLTKKGIMYIEIKLC